MGLTGDDVKTADAVETVHSPIIAPFWAVFGRPWRPNPRFSSEFHLQYGHRGYPPAVGFRPGLWTRSGAPRWGETGVRIVNVHISDKDQIPLYTEISLKKARECNQHIDIDFICV